MGSLEEAAGTEGKGCLSGGLRVAFEENGLANLSSSSFGETEVWPFEAVRGGNDLREVAANSSGKCPSIYRGRGKLSISFSISRW